MKIFFLLFLSTSFLFGEILESSKFSDILKYAGPNTLVLVDLDRTLLDADLMLGTSQAKQYFIKKAKAANISNQEIARLKPIYVDFIWQVVPFHLVDPDAADVINDLLSNHIPVLACTARGYQEQPRTLFQLSQVGVSFDQNFGSFVIPQHNAGLQEGIMYTGDLLKAEVVSQFLSTTNRCFDQIILIDDRPHNHEEMETLFKGSSIKFVGLRFNASDARVASYDSRIVELQWCALPQLLSDSDAKARLTGNQ